MARNTRVTASEKWTGWAWTATNGRRHHTPGGLHRRPPSAYYAPRLARFEYAARAVESARRAPLTGISDPGFTRPELPHEREIVSCEYLRGVGLCVGTTP